jgi:alkylation response protein AidB-like acyl-CoA dehydrogenase
VHFAFEPHQVEFGHQLRSWADTSCTPADVRAAWASPAGWSRRRWRQLAELGVAGLTVPADHGGLGLGLVDLALVLEEAGRANLPEPVVDTVAVGVPLLAQLAGAGAAGLARRWLPAVAAGEAAVALAEPGRGAAVRAGADLALVMENGTLHAVDRVATAGAGARRSVDGTRVFVDVSEHLGPASALVEGEAAGRLWRAAADRGAWGSAAVLVGVADRLLGMAVGYAKARRQFGVPIGSFQAVKHRLADALVRLEFARPLVYRAAWSLDEGEADAPAHVSMAKAAASDAACLAASSALQVHGAIGYSWEHDLHLWMKRAWALAGAWGDAGWHRGRLLGLVGS